MEKIELNIVALSHSVTHSHNYAVVLGEVEGNRRLPIVIGGFEAQAIAVAMEEMIPTRPLTHDLFKNTLDTFEIQVIEVVINNLLDGVFHARLVCERNGQTFEIDSRTSDAIAMAVRCECPIYTYEFILEAAGVVIEDSDDEGAEPSQGRRARPRRRRKSYREIPMEELEQLLERVISEEDYEKAAKIRDEINRRNQGEEQAEDD
ncbi:MAG: bifunctional nuclease family protein [Saprospiraceae bacterium]|nr:bifunctional nuclease family protein [Saprospiraceae bacterium]